VSAMQANHGRGVFPPNSCTRGDGRFRHGWSRPMPRPIGCCVTPRSCVRVHASSHESPTPAELAIRTLASLGAFCQLRTSRPTTPWRGRVARRSEDRRGAASGWMTDGGHAGGQEGAGHHETASRPHRQTRFARAKAASRETPPRRPFQASGARLVSRTPPAASRPARGGALMPSPAPWRRARRRAR
jgi:hypothetical protein